MKQTEIKHLEDMEKLLVERRVRPTALLPLWDIAGFALGAASAVLGREAAMACTVAVEEVISAWLLPYRAHRRLVFGVSRPFVPSMLRILRPLLSCPPPIDSPSSLLSHPRRSGEHYNDQIRELLARAYDEDDLTALLQKNRDEELEHLHTAEDNGAKQAPMYDALTNVIKVGCKAAIWASKSV